MIAKYKAHTLILEYYSYIKPLVGDSNANWQMARNCAITAVNELIKLSKTNNSDSIDYWITVKIELESISY